MKLFISWSGPTSQQIAEELRSWLPLILPSVVPFITTTDIDKGAKWQGEISRELEQSNYGIVCLTADNLESQWLAFEAGALSKHLVEGRVATLLFETKHGDVRPPLGMFQGTLFNESDVRQLVLNINAAVPDGQRRGPDQIDKVFLRLWPDLEKPIRLILQTAAAKVPSKVEPAPDAAAIATEMMSMLRQQNVILSAPEKLFAPVLALVEDRLAAMRRMMLRELREVRDRDDVLRRFRDSETARLRSRPPENPNESDLARRSPTGPEETKRDLSEAPSERDPGVEPQH
jgi:hypothetical protein